jgi:hypothetical protein
MTREVYPSLLGVVVQCGIEDRSNDTEVVVNDPGESDIRCQMGGLTLKS